MAYAFRFPNDITDVIYSMRDGKNWNGDKHTRGKTRDCCDWYTIPRSVYNPGLAVLRQDLGPDFVC